MTLFSESILTEYSIKIKNNKKIEKGVLNVKSPKVDIKIANFEVLAVDIDVGRLFMRDSFFWSEKHIFSPIFTFLNRFQNCPSFSESGT